MFRFELVKHLPNHEEYLILLPPGVPRRLVEPVIIDSPEEKMQEVGHCILSRETPGADRLWVMVHPDLTEDERRILMKQIEGLCGKHVYCNGTGFEPMLVLSEQLRSQWEYKPGKASTSVG